MPGIHGPKTHAPGSRASKPYARKTWAPKKPAPKQRAQETRTQETRERETRSSRTSARLRTRVVLGSVTGALVCTLAACGGGGGGGVQADGSRSAAPAASSGRPGATRVDVTLVDFRITLPKTSFTAGHYDFVARNSGRQQHALEIEGPGGEHRTRTLGPGESASLAVTLKPGTYKVYCPVDGHRAMGMQTHITARAGTASPGTGGSPAGTTPPGSTPGSGGYHRY